MKISIYRKEQFNAAHRLHNPNWSEEKNKSVFGKCNHANYHGHNYELIVKITGLVDTETGYLMDLSKLSQIIKEEIIDVFDHKNLNLDIEEFKNKIPTTENFAALIWNKLKHRIENNMQLTVILYETKRNFVEYSGE